MLLDSILLKVIWIARKKKCSLVWFIFIIKFEPTQTNLICFELVWLLQFFARQHNILFTTLKSGHKVKTSCFQHCFIFYPTLPFHFHATMFLILLVSKNFHWVCMIQDIFNINVCKSASSIKLEHINKFLK